ncbi:NPCBM-associated, NEW3 domain of alpha-galactosidase [uncultured archaeon]|nr:NPCBM-associated, NEW3 domain of alpha-galactosidase [uncultured archaeon]
MKTPNMTVKNQAFPLFALSLFFLLFLSGAAFSSVNPKLQLINSSLSEVPALPGHVVALTLHLKSMESDNCADHVSVQLKVAYPLSIQGSDTLYADSLCYSDPESAGTFVFLLPVDNLATSGTYPVSVSTVYEKRFAKFTEANTVNVRVGGSPAFTAAVTSSSPVDVYAGDTAQVTVTFQNTGPTLVSSARSQASSSGVETKWSSQDQTLGSIAARGSASAVFAIEAPKDLAPGDYPLRIHLDYTGEDRQNGSADFRFMVPVKPKADFAASYSSQAVLRAGAAQDTGILLTNTGSQEARKLKVRIRPLFPFSTDGTVRYVDSLMPGQSVNLSYTITVDKDATSGSQLTGLAMDFEDPQGKSFSDTADFAMPVRPATLTEELEAYAPLFYLIGAAAALVILRRLFGLASKSMKKEAKK